MPGFTKIVLDQAQIDRMGEPGSLAGMAIVTSSAHIVARGARRRVPVLTGALYDSVEAEVGADEKGLYGRVYAAWYDKFLEGPAKQVHRARRSLRTALRDIPKLL